MMPRVLFVDDAQAILDGIRAGLHRRRSEWEMVFADGGAAALAQCAKQAFDIIVTDMRMPGMDGAALLREIQRTYPDTVRIVLTGHTELEAALRTIPTAHQCLIKPCGRDVLIGVVRRACELRTTLKHDGMRRALGGIGKLPTTPLTYSRVMAALSAPGRTLSDVTVIVERDIALSAKLLQLVNSSFIGLGRSTSSVNGAISYLGLAMVEKVVPLIQAFGEMLPEAVPEPGVIETIQRHSLHVACIARQLAASPLAAEEAFTAGMLHDIGRLFLATQLPGEYAASLEREAANDEPLVAVEKAMFGASHAELGAYLLGLWGLPQSIVDAVASHHAPDERSGNLHDTSVLVRLGVQLSSRTAPWGSPTRTGGQVDAAAGIAAFDMTREWLDMAANLALNLAPD